MELAYTRDLKSLARNGLMGSSPIGATIPLPLAVAFGGTPSGVCCHWFSTQEVKSLRLDGFTGGLKIAVRRLWVLSRIGTAEALGLLAQLAEHRTFNPQVLGSTPRQPTIYSDIAQLVEQAAVNRWVAGSNPAVGAIMGGNKATSIDHKSGIPLKGVTNSACRGDSADHPWPTLFIKERKQI